jgi:phage terminase small subunit
LTTLYTSYKPQAVKVAELIHSPSAILVRHTLRVHSRLERRLFLIYGKQVNKLARAPDARIDQAKELYLQGKKLTEIASQLGLPEGTVRRWKSTYKWDKGDTERSEKKSERSLKNNERSNKRKTLEERVVESEVKQVMENPKLTDKRQLFCMFYVRCFNATKAYQKAYQCSYQMACGHGHELLKNVEIKNEIQRLKQSRLNRELLDESDIFQKYMDIAFSDITDYLTFGTEEVPVIGASGLVEVKDPDTGEKKPLTKIVNFVRFKPSAEIDGTILAEVKQGKDGASIKLADRMKALDWLAAHMDLATAEQKAKIAQINAQTERLKQDNEQEELADDGFLQALEGNAAADWEGWTDEPDKES